MKKIIFGIVMVLATLSFINAEGAIVTINRSEGGGSVWNLWAEYYKNVSETHNSVTGTHVMNCSGDGRLDCRWKINPPVDQLCQSYTNLYDDAENYAGLQIEAGNLTGSYSDMLDCQGNPFIRTVQWNGTDINNNVIIITVLPF